MPLFGAGSQNLVTLIFTKTTFCNAGIPKAWLTFCQILVALDQLEPPLKSINHASKYRIYERYHYFGAHFTVIDEKDAQNIVT